MAHASPDGCFIDSAHTGQFSKGQHQGLAYNHLVPSRFILNAVSRPIEHLAQFVDRLIKICEGHFWVPHTDGVDPKYFAFL
jgi:hypothetical protein